MRKQTKTAREILRMEYGASKNFMTPNILKMGKLNQNVAYELSQGRGFDNDNIYGVSLASYNQRKGKTRRLGNISQMFHTKIEAHSYIDNLSRRFKKNFRR